MYDAWIALHKTFWILTGKYKCMAGLIELLLLEKESLLLFEYQQYSLRSRLVNKIIHHVKILNYVIS